MSKIKALNKVLKQSTINIRKRMENRNKNLIGLNQRRFESEKSFVDMDTSFIGIRRYKVKPSKIISISAGSLILSTGLGISLSIIAFGIPTSSNSQFFDFVIRDAGGISGIFYLLSLIFLEIITDPIRSLSTLAVGWFFGGFVSAMVYKREGKKGPVYSAYLMLSVTISIAFITGIMLINDGMDSSSASEGSVGSILNEFIQLLMIGIVTTLISFPMIFVAWLGYKFGMYFATV